MKNKFLSLLTTSLSLGTVPPRQLDALDAWADHWLPTLTAEGKALFTGVFSYQELGVFAETAVAAAQDLKGVFEGRDRAKIAQAVLSSTVKALLPDGYEQWVIPLIQGPGAAALIEAAFQRLFGAGQQAAPVVDASDVPAGGVQ